jgi:hypothetical protein
MFYLLKKVKDIYYLFYPNNILNSTFGGEVWESFSGIPCAEAG